MEVAGLFCHCLEFPLEKVECLLLASVSLSASAVRVHFQEIWSFMVHQVRITQICSPSCLKLAEQWLRHPTQGVFLASGIAPLLPASHLLE